jgi:hypothetical protein
MLNNFALLCGSRDKVLSFPLLSVMLTVKVFVHVLMKLREFLLLLLERFHYEWVLNFVFVFSASVEMIM